MLAFNDKGYLKPEGVIECDWETFLNTFVFNKNRERLFDDFNLFCIELKIILTENFHIWVNGSFISKKAIPKDIDLVVFIDYEIYEEHEITIRALRNKFSLMDCYFVKKYPIEHPNYFISTFDRTEYLHLFSTDRKRNSKGFIQLNF